MLDRLSIRARLTAAFAAALLLVLALAGLFVYLRVGSDLSGSIDDALNARAGTVARSSGGPGRAPRLSNATVAGKGEGFGQVLTPAGRIIESSLPPRAGPALTPAEARRASTSRLRIDGRAVAGVEGQTRILARPAADGSYVVVVGASTDDRRDTLAGISHAFLLGAPLALLLASGLGYLLAGRALKPVEAMRRRAEEITLERSGERLPLPAADDELHQLAETLNRMLDRIEASLERERVFVADASHELRTPLANLRAELELSARRQRSPEELRQTVDSAGEEVERLSRLADDLLVIARLDQGRLPIAREPVELRGLLERVRERFLSRATDAGRRITVDARPGEHAELDALRMEQALGNLVDNALRHGRDEVRLAGRRNGHGAEFEVSDRGPGFPAGFGPRAFERFSRADPARSGEGAGLGLAIAQAVATAHGGRATIARSSQEGSSVRIFVPL
jgi:two-component system OmpR family sensor kinase